MRTNTMTRAEIIEIYEYCVGGDDIGFKAMKKEVENFLKEDRGDLKEYINEIKGFESRELSLSGYYDY